MSRLVATLGRICAKKKRKRKKWKVKKKEMYLKKIAFHFHGERLFCSVRPALERNTWKKNSAAKKTL